MSADEEARAQKPTQYVVLQLADVRQEDIPEPPPGYMPAARIDVWVPLLNERAEQGEDQAVRIVEGRSDREAIRIATRLDGEDRQRPGSFKAVPLRSWRGGVRHRDKTMTVTETEELED